MLRTLSSDASLHLSGGSKDKRLFIFDGGVKFGSYVKVSSILIGSDQQTSLPSLLTPSVPPPLQLAHQNLAGVHVAASAEAMAFAAKLGLPLRKVYARVIESRGFSWMYRNRSCPNPSPSSLAASSDPDSPLQSLQVRSEPSRETRLSFRPLTSSLRTLCAPSPRRLVHSLSMTDTLRLATSHVGHRRL